ncbi:serine/threonine-protein kinase [Herbiconiux sp. P16]|uniref:serine/threonine-protein kinase n=1 Tax=Herbiconiux wuyangfengii TaxID=3342794 RepID=UPI0035B9B1CF
MNARRPPSTPPEIPGFAYVELLGSGGFADVFLYEQQMPRRRVAIKVLLKESLTEGARESFDAEANLMAQLSTHPSIVTIYQAGIAADGRPYLAMEYCPKPNLGARYRREKIGVAEALRIGVQVAGAVETSHRAGILHRDIKPANILVTEYNRPALTDFGISVALVGGGAEQESIGMSIPWSPPEVFGALPSSGTSADIYSLGATVYTLLAGRSPFEVTGGANSGLDLIARIQSTPLSRTGRADVPDSLEQVLATAMAKREDARFGSALEFARALQKVQLELSLSVTPADVLDDALPAEDLEEEDDGNTRIRGIVSIDPTAPPLTGRNRGGRGADAPSPAPGAPAPFPSATPGSATGPGGGGTAGYAAPPDHTQLRHAPAAAPGTGPGTGAGASARPAVGPSAGAASTGAGTAPSRHPGFAPAEPAVETTLNRPPAPPTAPTDTPTRRSRVPLIIGAAALLVVIGIAGIVFAVNAGTGSPAAQQTDEPIAPIDVVPDGATSIEAPEALSGTVTTTDAGPGIVFTWTNPDPHDGDFYQWGVVTPGTETEYHRADDSTVTVPAPASGQVCIEVSIVHPDGRGSDPTTGCAP